MTKEEYKCYLKTEHWIKLAAETKTRRPHCESDTCPFSGISRAESLKRFGYDLQVHHLNYDNLYCEQPEDLQVLCFKCHEQASGISRERFFVNDGRIEWI
jgi:hypothetical protein